VSDTVTYILAVVFFLALCRIVWTLIRDEVDQ